MWRRHLHIHCSLFVVLPYGAKLQPFQLRASVLQSVARCTGSCALRPMRRSARGIGHASIIVVVTSAVRSCFAFVASRYLGGEHVDIPEIVVRDESFSNRDSSFVPSSHMHVAAIWIASHPFPSVVAGAWAPDVVAV